MASSSPILAFDGSPGSMFHVKHEGWRAVATAVGILVDDRAEAQLVAYERLLRERAVPLGMIAADDLGRLWERHILDGLRGTPLLPGDAASAIDLGSGAGIPGVPVAIARPDLAVTLAETRRSRAAFLELVVAELGLKLVRVHAGRIEDLAGPFDVALARAFADVRQTWRVAQPLLRPDGCLVYWGGRTFDPTDAPPGVAVRVFPTSALANAGPVAIMTQQ